MESSEPQERQPEDRNLEHARPKREHLALLEQAHRLAAAVDEPYLELFIEMAPRLLSEEEFDDLVADLKAAKQEAAAAPAPEVTRLTVPLSAFDQAGRELEQYLSSLERLRELGR